MNIKYLSGILIIFLIIIFIIPSGLTITEDYLSIEEYNSFKDILIQEGETQSIDEPYILDQEINNNVIASIEYKEYEIPKPENLVFHIYTDGDNIIINNDSYTSTLSNVEIENSYLGYNIYLDHGYIVINDVTHTQELSIFMTIKTDYDNGWIINCRNNLDKDMYQIIHYQNKLRYTMYHGVPSESTSILTEPIFYEGYKFIGMASEGLYNTNLTAYKDNNIIDSVLLNGNMPTETQDIIIGRAAFTTNYDFKGNIKEIYIYNTYINHTEEQILYNISKHKYPININNQTLTDYTELEILENTTQFNLSVQNPVYVNNEPFYNITETRPFKIHIWNDTIKKTELYNNEYWSW